VTLVSVISTGTSECACDAAFGGRLADEGDIRTDLTSLSLGMKVDEIEVQRNLSELVESK